MRIKCQLVLLSKKSNIKPDTVEVVGTKEEIESISSAKAYVDLKGVNKTVTKTAEVTLYNKEGKRLNVRTSPSKISVTLNVATQATANNTEKNCSYNICEKGGVYRKDWPLQILVLSREK